MKTTRMLLLMLVLIIPCSSETDVFLTATRLMQVQQEIIGQFFSMANAILDEHPEAAYTMQRFMPRLSRLSKEHDALVDKLKKDKP